MHPDQVRTILEQSADGLGKMGSEGFYGAGRVHVLIAALGGVSLTEGVQGVLRRMLRQNK